jgi:hypothetical protein
MVYNNKTFCDLVLDNSFGPASFAFASFAFASFAFASFVFASFAFASFAFASFVFASFASALPPLLYDLPPLPPLLCLCPSSLSVFTGYLDLRIYRISGQKYLLKMSIIFFSFFSLFFIFFIIAQSYYLCLSQMN